MRLSKHLGMIAMEDQQLDQESHVSINEYLRILYRGRWVIFFSFILIVAATAFITFTATPIYESGTKVIIKQKNSNMGESLFPLGGLMSKETMINNQVEILKSRTLAETVLQRLRNSEMHATLAILGNKVEDDDKKGMLAGFGKFISGIFNGDTEGETEELPDDAIVAALQQGLSILPIRNTDMINISVQATSAKEAAFIANTLTSAYAVLNRSMSQEEVRQVKDFLDNQLQVIQEQLTKSENALKVFKEKEKVIALPHETKELIENLAEFEGIYNEALTELLAQRERLKYIDQQLGISRKNFDIETISSTPYLAELRKQIADIDQKRARWIAALMNEGVDYRQDGKLKRLDENKELLKKKFKEQVSQLAARDILDPFAVNAQLLQRKIGVETEIQALNPKVESLKVIVDEYEQQLKGLPQKSLKLAQLERSAKVDEKIFLMMKEKYQESRITEVGQLGDVRIIDGAKPPRDPIKPKKRVNMILGAIIGLGVGIGLTFLIEAMDGSIRTMEDLEKIGLSVLGAIPFINEDEALSRARDLKVEQQNGRAVDTEVKRTAAARMISHFSPKSPISEAYRTFRTNIQYSTFDRELRVLIVTSPGPGEGKSTTIANLAITMAQMGSKVLLIDADLRRPVLHTIFSEDRRVGLTNVLIGRSELKEAVKKTEINNLYFMASGTLPPNPSELLGSKAMKELVGKLKETYDIVLIDSPPVIAVTDSAVLGNIVDGIVLVTRSAQSDREGAKRAYALLKNIGAPVLGAVLNGVHMESMYGSHYYYYYYGNEDVKKKGKRAKRKG